jgi:hypothetical protein
MACRSVMQSRCRWFLAPNASTQQISERANGARRQAHLGLGCRCRSTTFIAASLAAADAALVFPAGGGPCWPPAVVLAGATGAAGCCGCSGVSM